MFTTLHSSYKSVQRREHSLGESERADKSHPPSIHQRYEQFKNGITCNQRNDKCSKKDASQG